MKIIFLSAPSVYMIQDLIRKHVGITVLPFLHTQRYRHTVYIDAENTFGEGHNALISNGGPDRSMVQVLSKSIVDFLEDYQRKLESNWYNIQNGQIESFPRVANAEGAFGSVTTTNGIRIEAAAKYI